MRRRGRVAPAGSPAAAAAALLLPLLVLGTAGPAAAEERRALDGRLSLDVPPPLAALTPADIRRKWPTANPPKEAFGDARQSIAVALGAIRDPAPDRPIGEIGDKLREGVERGNRTVRTISAETRAINGTDWYLWRFESQAIDQPVTNSYALGRLAGGAGLALVNMNATTARLAEAEPLFSGVLASLRVMPE